MALGATPLKLLRIWWVSSSSSELIDLDGNLFGGYVSIRRVVMKASRSCVLYWRATENTSKREEDLWGHVGVDYITTSSAPPCQQVIIDSMFVTERV
jgi:hypothetical protein